MLTHGRLYIDVHGLPLDQRLEIVRLRENGLTFAQIARDKKMNESSIKTIWKNKGDIKRQGIQTAKIDTDNCLEKIGNGAAFAHLVERHCKKNLILFSHQYYNFHFRMQILLKVV